MDLQERIKYTGKPLLAVTMVTATLSIGGNITRIVPAMEGEGYGYTRIGLGLLGAAGAALVVFGRDYSKSGLIAIVAWSVLQNAFYAIAPVGKYTRQLFDGLLGISSHTTVNRVTETGAIGLNLVGLAMLAFAYCCRSHLAIWQNRATRGCPV